MDTEQHFVDFVSQSSGPLFRTAFLLTGNSVTAEDLLQDTFARLYPKWKRVVEADAPFAYVRRSMVNQYATSIRQRRLHEVTTWDLPDGWDGRDVAEGIVNSSLVWELIGTLAPRQRAAVVLRFVHDLSDEDIAETLACRPATVRSLLSRSVQALRTRVDLDGDVGGRIR